MNRTRLVLAGRFLLAIALAGCSTAADRGGTGIPATPSPSATETTVAPSPSQEIRIWGGFAVSISYGSFAEWSQDLARHGDGVALVRVVNVSDFSWSTSSGGPPGPADVARYNRAEVDFGIGRLVTVELVRMLRGTWPASSTAFYWLPGGQIENDLTPPLDLNTLLIEPRPGLLAVASTWPGADLDGTDGVLWLNVQQLFPADASGRVRTFNPDEAISVDDVERYLPAP